jgi:hypothetical protein
LWQLLHNHHPKEVPDHLDLLHHQKDLHPQAEAVPLPKEAVLHPQVVEVLHPKVVEVDHAREVEVHPHHHHKANLSTANGEKLSLP